MSSIERSPVSSSNVKSIGHCGDTNTLAVEFKDGTVYHYADVDKDTHDQLVSSKSVGGAVHSMIKGKYSCSKQ
jgi:hypothetical protein